MAAANAATARAVERLGMSMISPEQGVGAIQALLLRRAAMQPALTAAVPFRWGRFIRRLGTSPVPPMFQEFTAEAAVDAAQEMEAAGSLEDMYAASGASKLEESTVMDRRPAGSTRRRAGRKPGATAAAPTAAAAAHKEYMLGQVQEAVVAVLGSTVGLEDPLMAAGLDSLGSGESEGSNHSLAGNQAQIDRQAQLYVDVATAVELRNSLERRTGLELSSTLVFDYPTIAALAAFLASRAAPANEQPEVFDSSSLAWESGDEDEDGVPGGLALMGAAPLRLVAVSEAVARIAGDALSSPLPSDQSQPIPLERWDVEAQAELCGGIPVQVRSGSAPAGTLQPHIANELPLPKLLEK